VVTVETLGEMFVDKHLSSLLFLSFVSVEISRMVRLREMCFTSDETLFGNTVDVLVLE
jgi:hypothetical protein